ncbi:MAG: ComEC/Rec2 family competence protein [Clostridia bacterium]
MITPYRKTILIDGGGSKNEKSFDVGEGTLLPFLLNRKIKKLDYILVSHFDSDHCNGLIAVLENRTVGCLIIGKQPEITEEYKRIMEIAERRKIKVIEGKRGDRILIDRDTTLKILHPSNKVITENALNNNALVCKLQYGKSSILFTGDIEKEAENQLLAENSQKYQATILKVAHHGSKTSSSKEFLEAVDPKIALIGVGKKNTFGHPNQEVINRLQEEKVKIYRTDEDGEIEMKITKKRENIYKKTIRKIKL